MPISGGLTYSLWPSIKVCVKRGNLCSSLFQVLRSAGPSALWVPTDSANFPSPSWAVQTMLVGAHVAAGPSLLHFYSLHALTAAAAFTSFFTQERLPQCCILHSSLHCLIINFSVQISKLCSWQREQLVWGTSEEKENTEDRFSVFSPQLCVLKTQFLCFEFSKPPWTLIFCKIPGTAKWVHWWYASLSCQCQSPMKVLECSEFCTHLAYSKFTEQHYYVHEPHLE